MLELHLTSFKNMLSHDNITEKCSNEHIQKKKKEKKDENKCRLQKKKENKTRTKILNCRNVKGGLNPSTYPLMNPFTPMAWVLVFQKSRNQPFVLITN